MSHVAQRTPHCRPFFATLVGAARGFITATLVMGTLLPGGCVWSRKGETAIPGEVARCRELTEQGTLAMQEGQLAAAEAQFRNALLANPTDMDARRLFAETLWARGEMTAAIAQMEATRQLAPHDTALTVRVGEMLLATGETAQAITRADEAIDQNPQYGSAWALRGQANWTAGHTTEAIANLQRALVHAPSDEGVLLTLATLYLEKGEPRRALTTLHQLQDVCPPGTEPQQALALEGRAYLALGRPTDAVETLTAASQRGNPQAEIFFLLAAAESQRGRKEAAVRAAHHAIAADPNHRNSLRLLAELNGSPDYPSAVLRR